MQPDFPPDNATFLRLVGCLSVERLSRYRPQPADSDADVLARYLWNLDLSAALWPSVHLAEVTLRNRLHTAATTLYGLSWYDDPAVVQRKQERDDLVAARDKLRREQKPPDAPHLIATLDFGFWTALMKRTYESGEKPLWPAALQLVLPNLNPLGSSPDRGRGRKYAEGRFDMIRKIRNRISHHEPIWIGRRLDSRWQRVPIAHDYSLLIEALGWLSPDVRAMALQMDTFPAAHDAGYITHLAMAVRILGLGDPSVPEVPDVT